MTFNPQRSGAAKVHWLADMVWDASFPIDVLAILELDLHENSVPAFIELLRARKVHVFLGGCLDGVYRCAVLSKPAYTGHGVGKAGSAGPHCRGEPLAAGLADWREAGHGFVTVPSRNTT